MASLKQLVNLKRNLDKFRNNTEIRKKVESISAHLQSIRNESSLELIPAFTEIIQLIDGVPYPEKIQNIISEIDKQIRIVEQELPLFTGGPMTVEQNREVLTFYDLPYESIKQITAKITSYTSWQYPSLEIGPGDGLWTHLLQHAQPLVIADIFDEFLASSVKAMTQQVQDRIITYKINDNILDLPKKQFGFILCWNLFNFFPTSLLENYVKQCFDLLRPGGTFMFSFNDGEIPFCAEMAENKQMSYYTSSKLYNLCRKIGYQKVETVWSEQHITWAEITKPGKLDTIKTHPTIGIIKQIE